MIKNPQDIKIEEPTYFSDPNDRQSETHDHDASKFEGHMKSQTASPQSNFDKPPVNEFLISQKTVMSPEDRKFQNIMKLQGKINEIKSSGRKNDLKHSEAKLSTRRASHAIRPSNLMKETAKLKNQALLKQRNFNRSSNEAKIQKPQTVKNGVHRSQLIFGISQNQGNQQQLDKILYNQLIAEKKQVKGYQAPANQMDRKNTPSIPKIQLQSPILQESQPNFKLFENRKSVQVSQIQNDLNDQDNYNQRRIRYVERQMQHLQRQRNKSQQQLSHKANQYQLRKLGSPSSSHAGIQPSEFFNKRKQMNQKPTSDNSGSVGRQSSQMINSSQSKHQVSELRIKNFNEINNQRNKIKLRGHQRSNQENSRSRSNSSEMDPIIIENRYKRLNKNYNQIFKNLNEQRIDYKNQAIVNQHMMNSQEMNYYNRKNDDDNSTFEHPLQPQGTSIKDYFAMPSIASPSSDMNMMNSTAAGSNQQQQAIGLPGLNQKRNDSNNNYQNNINNSIILVQSPEAFITSQEQPQSFNQVSQDLKHLQDQLRMGVLRDQFFSNREPTTQNITGGDRKMNSPTSEGGAPYRSKIGYHESQSQGNQYRLSNSPQNSNERRKRSRNRPETNNLSQDLSMLSQDKISSNDPESLDRQNTHMLMKVLYNSLKKQMKKPVRKKPSLASEVKNNLMQQSFDYIQGQKNQNDSNE